MGDHTRLHCCVDRIRQIASLDARYGHRPAPERVSELIGRDCIQADDAAQPSVCAQPYLHRHLPPPSTFSTLMIDEVPNGGAPASELVPRERGVERDREQPLEGWWREWRDQCAVRLYPCRLDIVDRQARDGDIRASPAYRAQWSLCAPLGQARSIR